VCAFIDSDAYPPPDWLINAIKYLGGEVVAVGGPGITPPNDSPMQKASGYVYAAASLLSNLSGRFRVGNKRAIESDDVHSCNFIAYKRAFEEVGGWNEEYWPGEDTLLCQALIERGYKLLEAPDVIVYHHRKPLFRRHLKQVKEFALHRGFFAKKYGGNSRKVTYAIPSAIVMALLGGLSLALSTMHSIIWVLYRAGVLVYLSVTLLASALVTKEWKLLPLVWVGVILTHLVYGTYYLIGLLKKDLER